MCPDFRFGEPVDGDNVRVQHRPRVQLCGTAKERGPVVGDAITGRGVERRTDDALQLHPVASFLEGLPQGGLKQCFPGFQVSRGLVEDAFGPGVFLDHEETTRFLNNRGHRNVCVPFVHRLPRCRRTGM